MLVSVLDILKKNLVYKSKLEKENSKNFLTTYLELHIF